MCCQQRSKTTSEGTTGWKLVFEHHVLVSCGCLGYLLYVWGPLGGLLAASRTAFLSRRQRHFAQIGLAVYVPWPFGRNTRCELRRSRKNAQCPVRGRWFSTPQVGSESSAPVRGAAPLRPKPGLPSRRVCRVAISSRRRAVQKMCDMSSTIFEVFGSWGPLEVAEPLYLDVAL